MSDQDNMWEGTPENGAETGDATKNTPSVGGADLGPIGEWVGEDKKYKTVEDFVKGFSHLTDHAKTLEAENAQLRETSTKAASVDDVLKAIRESSQNSGKGDRPQLDEKEIAQLVRDSVTNIERERTATQNIAEIEAELRKTHGDKAPAYLAERAKALGISVKDIQNVAAKSPTAAKSLLMGAPSVKQDAGPATGTVRTDTFGSDGTNGVRGQSYYSTMRREDPKRFFTPEIQREREQALAKLGSEKFFNS